jgi:hypothetical protein
MLQTVTMVTDLVKIYIFNNSFPMSSFVFQRRKDYPIHSGVYIANVGSVGARAPACREVGHGVLDIAQAPPAALGGAILPPVLPP